MRACMYAGVYVGECASVSVWMCASPEAGVYIHMFTGGETHEGDRADSYALPLYNVLRSSIHRAIPAVDTLVLCSSSANTFTYMQAGRHL